MKPRSRTGALAWSALTGFAPWMLAITAAALVIVLQQRYDDLAERYGALRMQSIAAYAGLTVPSFDGVPAGGDSAIAVASMRDDERQVLLLVRAGCPYCKATIPVWRTLVAGLDSVSRAQVSGSGDAPRVRVLAISLDSLPDSTATLFAANDLDVPVVAFPSARLRRLYRGSLVPQTLVVDAEGRVLHARAGVFRTTAEADSVLHAATAPQLASSPAPAPAVQAAGITSR
ncbi:MAG: TlpA family protein disulfide reductase [Gemmatimonadaceae bacterium]